MKCPRCQFGKARSLFTQHNVRCITRRRRCGNCQHEFLTYEHVTPPIDHGLPPAGVTYKTPPVHRSTKKLRRVAALEACETGRDYQTICAELGVPLKRVPNAAERARILALKQENYAINSIARMTHWSWEMVAKVIREARNAADARTAA